MKKLLFSFLMMGLLSSCGDLPQPIVNVNGVDIHFDINKNNCKEVVYLYDLCEISYPDVMKDTELNGAEWPEGEDE